jgi:bifunctional oligoribonuclease and PAP phosphatase NrnA
MPYIKYAKSIHNHLVNKAQNILLLPHQNPDPDALASVCTFIHHLESLGKKYTAFCGTTFNDSAGFLPKVELIETDPTIIEKQTFDTICTFDAGDLPRALSTPQLVEKAKNATIINFDHHYTKEPYGDFKLVDLNASSTTMVLYQYFKHNNITIDQPLATCILTGLISDTENFTNAATRASTLETASELVSRGANMNLIKQEILRDKTVAGLKFWSIIFDRLYHNPKHNIAVTYVKQEDLKDYPIDDEELAGVSNFIKMIRDADLVLFLKETTDGKVKGSLRTTGEIDCAALAMTLGGGGHKKASGFAVDGVIKELTNGSITIDGTSAETAKLNSLISFEQ